VTGPAGRSEECVSIEDVVILDAGQPLEGES